MTEQAPQTATKAKLAVAGTTGGLGVAALLKTFGVLEPIAQPIAEMINQVPALVDALGYANAATVEGAIGAFVTIVASVAAVYFGPRNQPKA